MLIFLVALTRLKIKNPLIETLNAWGFWPGDVHDSGAVLFKVLFLLLLAVFVYVMVSFVDFLSKALVDALSVKNTVWIRLLVMAIIAIVIVYFGSMIAGHMTNFLNAHMAHQMKGQVYNDPIWMIDLELLIADLIIGVVNLWLFNKFVEAQINNKWKKDFLTK
ncbi:MULTISPECIES: hypothetical protein [Lactobacillus]|uniref:Uncharacterized protein n=1 Tax=Lactobacillus xujianguonis TaxID=2495899 RepID=A0A437SY27_9LACO|nr:MULTISPECIES: hypothetical protein [Lactobacillus]RVU71717.1 hypothetical protein EJK17_00110 [Lactobacillus xujianguonis]RVU77547.1 hypothetical protein EJK20_00945 [Lactobacillus xujianguonis]